VKLTLGAGHGRGMCEIKQLYKFAVPVFSWIKEKISGCQENFPHLSHDRSPHRFSSRETLAYPP
jgi:hypothetical protein